MIKVEDIKPKISFSGYPLGEPSSASYLNLWLTRYEADQLPTAAIPVWTKVGGFTADTEEISPAGFLHLVSNDSGEATYSQNESGIDNAVGTTIELRVKMISGYTFADQINSMSLELRDGVRQVWLDIYSDAIATKGETYEMDTTDDYHIYRVTVKGTETKVYVDGVLRITDNTSWAGAQKYVLFTGGSWYEGSIESSWDYVYYRTDGAFAPITLTLKPKLSLIETVKPKMNMVYDETQVYSDDYFLNAGEPMGLLLCLTYPVNESGTTKSYIRVYCT